MHQFLSLTLGQRAEASVRVISAHLGKNKTKLFLAEATTTATQWFG